MDWGEPVKAVLVMKPGELCWCGSGDEWKVCHKGRRNERVRKLKETLRELRREFATGYCSHPEAPKGCSAKPIRSHSIQKATGIRGIAEGGHVYTVRGEVNEKGEMEPAKIGVNDASTFLGFCNDHDTSMFKHIEGDTIEFDRQALFLFTYRALCFEIFNRKANVRGLHRNKIDAGKSLKEQEALVNTMRLDMVPMKTGLADYERWKALSDEMYLKGDFSNIKGVAVRFEGIIPFAASGVIQPWFDFQGRHLQDLMAIEHPSQMAYTLTQEGENSLLVFGWDEDKQGASYALVKDFLAIPDEQKATAASLFALCYGDNTFFKMSWWDELTDAQKARCMMAVAFGTDSVQDTAKGEVVMNPRFSPFKIDVPVKEIVVID